MSLVAPNADVLRLAVGLFGAAPSRPVHDAFAAELARGASPTALAEALAASDAFNALYPATLSDSAFADRFVASLLPAENAQWRAPAASWLSSLIADGASRAQAAWQAIGVLLDAVPAELTLARQQFVNRIEVASAYVQANGRAATLDAMRSVLADVGSAHASVEQAIARFTRAATDAWTLMIYMAADNDLERFAIDDLNELEALRLPEGVNIVVLVDRSPRYDQRNGNWSDTRVGTIQPDDDPYNVGTVLQSVGEWNTGSASSLAGFIDWAVQNKPAEHYGLVLWGHGRGITGVVVDGTSGNDWLTPVELRQAIDASQVGRLPFVGFDTCLMAGVETLAALAGRADVVLASQEEEPGEGWNYTRWLSQVFADGEADALELATTGIAAYRAEYAGRRDLTLSALDPDGYGALLAAVDGFARAARGATSEDWRLLQVARRAAPDFDYDKLVDLIAVTQALGLASAPLAEAARHLSEAAAAVVIDHSAMMANTHGLSVWWPEKRPYNVTSQYTDDIVGLVGTAAWRDFLADFWSHAWG